MAWILISAPVMVLALAIAVLPVLLGSLRAHRAENRTVVGLAQVPVDPVEVDLAEAA